VASVSDATETRQTVSVCRVGRGGVAERAKRRAGWSTTREAAMVAKKAGLRGWPPPQEDTEQSRGEGYQGGGRGKQAERQDTPGI